MCHGRLIYTVCVIRSGIVQPQQAGPPVCETRATCTAGPPGRQADLHRYVRSGSGLPARYVHGRADLHDRCDQVWYLAVAASWSARLWDQGKCTAGPPGRQAELHGLVRSGSGLPARYVHGQVDLHDMRDQVRYHAVAASWSSR